MANRIVTVNVNQTIAPTPDTLQRTGALISQGGTTLASGSYSLLTQPADLTPLLSAALALTSLVSSGTTATATTASPHGVTNGDTFLTVIAGASPAGYNGTVLATATGASTFTYTLATTLSSPATGSITYTPRNVAELTAMATSFFGMGSQVAVYVLELGAGEPSAGVATLATFITANPGFFYSYLVPKSWDANSDFITFLAGFESTTSKTYFHVTTTTGTYTDYSDLLKCVVSYIQAPLAPNTEFTAATGFWVTLNYNPSSTNKVTPFAFSFLFGVTPYPTKGNAALLATLKAAFVNVVGTGAEGGISDAILLWGTTMDGRDFTYWYSVDWVQINSDLNISNAVINGSNNPINPLYYNQDGINRLQAVLGKTMASAATFGLALGQVILTELDSATLNTNYDNDAYVGKIVVNAIPFNTYLTDNPSDYKIGKYAGFAVIYVPQRGFIQIIININVTDFVVP